MAYFTIENEDMDNRIKNKGQPELPMEDKLKNYFKMRAK